MVSLYGNIDAYNAYRRTGTNNYAAKSRAKSGGFIRSFLYPASEANTNLNMQQNCNGRVFWDNNPLTGFPIGN
jgi:hypothetical protein